MQFMNIDSCQLVIVSDIAAGSTQGGGAALAKTETKLNFIPQ